MVAPHGALTGLPSNLTSSVAGFVTQCMVRSPATLYLSPPAFSIFVDLNAISGHLAASKKSGLLRCPSRFSLLVLMLVASIFVSTELLVGSSWFQFSVEFVLPNSP